MENHNSTSGRNLGDPMDFKHPHFPHGKTPHGPQPDFHQAEIRLFQAIALAIGPASEHGVYGKLKGDTYGKAMGDHQIVLLFFLPVK